MSSAAPSKSSALKMSQQYPPRWQSAIPTLTSSAEQGKSSAACQASAPESSAVAVANKLVPAESSRSSVASFFAGFGRPGAEVCHHTVLVTVEIRIAVSLLHQFGACNLSICARGKNQGSRSRPLGSRARTPPDAQRRRGQPGREKLNSSDVLTFGCEARTRSDTLHMVQ